MLSPISNIRRASQVPRIIERENKSYFDSRSSYNARYPIAPSAAPRLNLPLFPICAALPFATTLPTAVPVPEVAVGPEVEVAATLAGEVIVVLAANFSRLELPALETTSEVVVTATAAALKALKDASPAVILTGMKGGGPHKLFS